MSKTLSGLSPFEQLVYQTLDSWLLLSKEKQKNSGKSTLQKADENRWDQFGQCELANYIVPNSESSLDRGEHFYKNYLMKALLAIPHINTPKTRDEKESIPSRYYHLLNLKYFDKDAKFRKKETLAEDLDRSAAAVAADLRKAIRAFSIQLLKLIQATYQPELPARANLIGYRDAQTQCQLAIDKHCQNLVIVGPSGIGKTSLTSEIAHAWLGGTAQVFWYTFRLGINDTLPSILYELGRFFAHHGQFELRNTFATDYGKRNLALDVDLIKNTLQTLKHKPLLFCFDEVDTINTDFLPHHKVIRGFMEILCNMDHLPHVIIYIGHKNIILLPIGGVEIKLQGLNWLQTKQLLFEQAVEVDDELERDVMDKLKGIPLYVKIFSILLKQFQATPSVIKQTLHEIQDDSNFDAILLRLINKLSPEAILALYRVSIFTNGLFYATAKHNIYDKLYEMGLITKGQQGWQIASLLAGAVRRRLLNIPDTYRHTYLDAAKIYESFAVVIEAVNAYICAGDIATALQLWQDNMETEIQRGQGLVALNLFEKIEDNAISDKGVFKALTLLRAELYRLTGEWQKGKGELEKLAESRKIDKHDSEYIRYQMLHSKFLEDAGEFDAALEAIKNALPAASETDRAKFHVSEGEIYRKQGEVEQTWQSAHQARLASETFMGGLLERQGEYQHALVCLENAMQSALFVKDESAQANIYRRFAIIYAKQSASDEAIKTFMQSAQIYERRGDRANLNLVYSDLGALGIDANKPEITFEYANKALVYFFAVKNSFRIAHNQVNLGQAYLMTGELDKAKTMAEMTLSHEFEKMAGYACWLLAEIEMRSGNINTALVWAKQSAESATLQKDKWLLAAAHETCGNILAKVNKFSEAKTHWENAFQLYEELMLPQKAALIKAKITD